MKRVLLILTLCIFIVQENKAQTSIPLHTIVTQNFNSIGTAGNATLPANWRMSPSGNSVGAWSAGVTTTQQAANSGTPVASGRYNWATTAGSDRAIGFLTDGTYASPNAVMAYFRNTTGVSVSTVTVGYSVERYLVNTGAFSLVFEYSLNGTAWTVAAPGAITAGEFPTGAIAGTFASPKIISRLVTISTTLANNADIYFRWTFTTSAASQGLGLDNVSVFAGNPTPVVIANLRDILQVDNGTINQFNEGDVIRYQTIVKNTGTDHATNVQVTLPTPTANTTMVPGSIKTSAIAVDDNYVTSFSTMLSGSTVLANDNGIPVPAAVISFGNSADATTNAPGTTVTTDAGGSATLQANGTFTYTPPAAFSGTDRFRYITGNGNLPNNDAYVNILVASDISFTTTNVDPTCNNGSNGSITINATGGNGTLEYSKNGSGGPYQLSNIFTGLSSGLYNLAVRDAGGYIKIGSTTLNNPAPIVVSGSIPTIFYNTAMSTATFTKTGGTGATTWSATGLPTGVLINTSTGQVTGTPTVTGIFNATITATDINGCFGSLNISVSVGPKVVNDTYGAVVGNTQLVADGHSAPSTPFTTSATNILGNDESNAAITITAVTNASTSGNGQITISADGKFIYSPPIGFAGNDSYTYTATTNGVSATGTINFTIANVVWYVNNSYVGASDGRSHRPYLTTTDAASASSVNHTIYVHTGAGNTAGTTVLKTGQTLRGAGSALNIGALNIPAGTKPVISGLITLATNTTADGFDMSTGGAGAFTNAGATVTGVNVNVGNVTTTTGTGIAITGTGNSVTMTMASLTTNGAANAVNLVNTAGTVTINAGTQTGSTGSTFLLGGGTVSLTYTGNITQAANAAVFLANNGHTGTVNFSTGTISATNGTGLQFDNADGTYNFFGTTTLNGGDAGIDILNGSSGSFNFATTSGSIAITNPSGNGLTIGGTSNTCNVNYDGNISKTNTGSLVNISNHASGTVTFVTGNTLSATTASAGNGLQFDNADGTYNFNGTTTLNGGDAGIDILNGSAGNFTFGTGTAITSPSGIAFNVGSATVGSGSSCAITYNGTITKTSAGRLIEIQQKTGGTVSFAGAVSGTSPCTGVNLLTNTGATFNFSGGIVLNGAAAVFSATGGGTVNVTGATNTIGSPTAVTATALTITNTTIGASNVNFRSISTTGAPIGININNTGSSGGLIISGDGGGSNNGSGGLIQTSAGNGVNLISTVNASIGYMNINSNADMGMLIQNNTNLTINRCNLNNNGNSTSDDGILIGNRTGTAINGVTGNLSITNTVISASAHNNLHMRNVSGTLTSMTVTGSSFNNINDVTGANAFLFEASNTAIITAASITSCTFNNNSPQRALEVQAHDNTNIQSFTVQTSSFNDNGIHMSYTQDGNANFVFKVLNNTSMLNANPLQAINVFSSATTTGGTFQGRIEGNIIGNNAVAGSGSTAGSGIRMFLQGNVRGIFLINNNQIYETPASRGIDVMSGAFATNGVDLTITNNTIDHTHPGYSAGADFPVAAIYLVADNPSGFGNGTLRADVRGNTVPTTGGSWDYPTFDGNAPWVYYYEEPGLGNSLLVDFAPTGAASANAEIIANNPLVTSKGAAASVALLVAALSLPPL